MDRHSTWVKGREVVRWLANLGGDTIELTSYLGKGDERLGRMKLCIIAGDGVTVDGGVCVIVYELNNAVL